MAKIISGIRDTEFTTEEDGGTIKFTYKADGVSPPSRKYSIDIETAILAVRPNIFSRHKLWKKLGLRNQGVTDRINY